jgi:GntR family transcriptional regulator, transcriptional repressor for pyruvate dehydrogenase complex
VTEPAARALGKLRPPRRRRAGDAKPKAARRIAETIVFEIQRRDLRPGDKLISEQKMVERYGVARGSLREALRFLELQGVLRLKSGPGGGPVVDSPTAQHLAGTLALLLQFGGAPFRSIIETRLAIEPGIAALAAKNASEDDLAALRRCLDSMNEHIADADTFQEENRGFHDLVGFASGNLVFRFLLPALHWISDASGIVYTEQERRRVLRALRPILAAIEGRDPDAASQSMRRFFDASLVYLDRSYPEVMAKPVSWADLEL